MVDLESEQGEWILRSRLRQLVSDKENAEQRRIPQTEIAVATGLTEATVSKWMSFKAFTRIEASAAVALCQWVPCTLDQLLTAERLDSTHEAN